MQAWLAGIIVSLTTKLGSWLLARALEYFNKQQKHAATDADIDARLASVKSAYKDAFNGEKITPEQRKNLYQGISDFIRNTGDSGL